MQLIDTDPDTGQQSIVERLAQLKVRIFADGADLATMLDMARRSWIKGFTTNPTLMRNAGVTNYKDFALNVLAEIGDRPISFEVFADQPSDMEQQAREIASWAKNVYVKIPVTNTAGEPMYDLVHQLAHAGVNVNVTAIMTLNQVREVAAAVSGGSNCLISVFAGRIADTGRDPLPIMRAAVQELREYPNAELLWASPRELLNIFHADAVNCHVITATPEILSKVTLVGKDLDEYSLETVRMFHRDAAASGFVL